MCHKFSFTLDQGQNAEVTRLAAWQAREKIFKLFNQRGPDGTCSTQLPDTASSQGNFTQQQHVWRPDKHPERSLVDTLSDHFISFCFLALRPKHKWPEYVEGELTPSSAHGFGCFGSKTHNILHILRHFTSQASCLRSKSKRWKRKMPSLGPLPRDLPFLQNKLSWDRWESRREKLVNQIVDLDPDVVSLVTLGIRMGPL